MNDLGGKAKWLMKLQELDAPVPAFFTMSGVTKSSIETKRKQYLEQFHEWKEESGTTTCIVRSSADVEDGSSMSYAGQFSSVRDVENDEDFIAALQDIADFKIAKGYTNKQKVKMNVIVQEQISAHIGGVAFSVNPGTGDFQYVINYSSSDPHGVVEGKPSAQVFIDRLSLNVIDNTQPAGGQKEENLPDKTSRQLAEWIGVIEKELGILADVEWFVDQSGKLHIVQVRPITSINMLRVWDSSNLSESFPGIVLPLTFSVARRGYELVYKSQATAGGMKWYGIEENHRVFNSMIGIFAGRMYYNMLSWYRFAGLFPANNKNQEYLDLQIQTAGNALYLPKQKFSFSYKLRFWARLLKRTFTIDYELFVLHLRYERITQYVDKIPLTKNPYVLMERFHVLEQKLLPYWGKTVDNDFLAMVYNGMLVKIIAKQTGKDPKDVNHSIGILGDVVSTEQALSLKALSEELLRESTIAKVFKAKDFDKVDELVKESSLQQEINTYKKRFGHRFARDQILEAENPQSEDKSLYELIWLYSKLDTKSFEKRIQKATVHSSKQQDEIISELTIVQKMAYRVLSAKLRKRLRIREQNRLLRGRIYAYFRELFPKLGEAFVEQGVIKKPRDIFYMEIEEITSFLNGSLAVNDIQQNIASRKKAYQSYEKLQAPRRFVTTGIPELEYKQIWSEQEERQVTGKKLSGIISSPGTVSGKATVLDRPEIPKEPFDILVARSTDPGWTALIALSKGVIIEHGGMLSHAAIVTRELGIPSIIGVEGATGLIRSGQKVTINSAEGVVELG